MSSDKNDAEFTEYFGSMPWTAVPFTDRDRKTAASTRYSVRGIPTFVVLSPQGETITRDGVSEIFDDQAGARFPWRPRSYNDVMLTGSLLTRGGSVDTRTHLEGKYTFLYFSASWCGPCRSFTPKLKSYYANRQRLVHEAAAAAGGASAAPMEVVLVTGDETAEDMTAYYADMPWAAIPFGDARIAALNKLFAVKGIPHIVIVSPEGKVVNDDAVGAIADDVNGDDFPHVPSPLLLLHERTGMYGASINDVPTLVVMCEQADDGETNDILGALGPLAEQHVKLAGDAGRTPPMLVAAVLQSTGMSEQIRKMCGLKPAAKDTSVRIVVLNVPQQSYHIAGSDASATALASLADAILAGGVAWTRMSA